MADPAKIFEAYGLRLRRKKVGKTALYEYGHVTRHFMAWMREQGLGDLEEIRRHHIEEFFADTGWGPSTIRQRVNYLRAPWSYALEEEMVTRTPFLNRLALPKVPEREPKVVPNAVLRKVKAELVKDTDRTLFCLLAYQGMRACECRRLQWEGVSMADQTLNFIGKDDRERTIPMHPETQEAIRRQGAYRNGSMFVLPGQRGAMRSDTGLAWKIDRMVGRRPYTAHDFRRTVASSLEANEARVAAIKQILGWSKAGDVRLQFYTALPQKVLYRELLKLYADDPV